MCEQGVNFYITRFSPRNKLKSFARFFISAALLWLGIDVIAIRKSDHNNNTNDWVSNIFIFGLKTKQNLNLQDTLFKVLFLCMHEYDVSALIINNYKCFGYIKNYTCKVKINVVGGETKN